MNQSDINPHERNEETQDEILSAVLRKLSSETTGSTPLKSTSNNQNIPVNLTGAGDAISSLLSNPELIAKLPTLIASVKPILEMLGKSSASNSDSATISTELRDVNLPSSTQKMQAVTDSRTALLCAMKPYLSEDRRNAIDYIVKLGKLGEILKTL